MSTLRDSRGVCPRCGQASNSSSQYCDCQEQDERKTYERSNKVEEENRALRARLAEAERDKAIRPWIVCLCGSTRFMDAFFEQGWNETLKGRIVLSVGVCKHAEDHGGEALGENVAAMLDELHKRKIDLADEVLVLNVGGYIGKSTRSEIDYAIVHGKPIRYLESALSKLSAGQACKQSKETKCAIEPAPLSTRSCRSERHDPPRAA
jgi:hypothetical protein